MSELDADQRQAIMSALEDKNPILAIKLYRDATGCSLRVAKEFVDQLKVALETGESPDSSIPELSTEATLQIVELLRKGDWIPAIKVYRSEVECGLRDAKDAVEAIASENGIQSAPSGCGVTVLALCCGMAALSFLFATAFYTA